MDYPGTVEKIISTAKKMNVIVDQLNNYIYKFHIVINEIQIKYTSVRSYYRLWQLRERLNKMSGTSANVAVYHLISELSDVPDDSMDNEEQQVEPFSPQAPTSNLEDALKQSTSDVSARLSDHRQRKRTTITPSQKAILEEFYANGMTSGGMQFSALHNAAAQKTGLTVHNIQVP